MLRNHLGQVIFHDFNIYYTPENVKIMEKGHKPTKVDMTVSSILRKHKIYIFKS